MNSSFITSRPVNAESMKEFLVKLDAWTYVNEKGLHVSIQYEVI